MPEGNAPLSLVICEPLDGDQAWRPVRRKDGRDQGGRWNPPVRNPTVTSFLPAERGRCAHRGLGSAALLLMVLQKEILYAMLGHTGKVVVETKAEGGQEFGTAFALASGLPLVDESERELVARLLSLGHCYRELEEFVGAQLFGEDDELARRTNHVSSSNGGSSSSHVAAGGSGGPYFLAFALGIEECLQPYRARVLHLEQRLIRQPDLSLPQLQLGFGDFEFTLPALRRLLRQVRKAELRGVALLDHLNETASGCVHSLRDALRLLLRTHTARVALAARCLAPPRPAPARRRRLFRAAPHRYGEAGQEQQRQRRWRRRRRRRRR